MKRLIRKNSNSENFIDFKPVFELLNDELSSAGVSLELICAGGYVMQLNGYRGTVDIDAFYRSNTLIEGIIQKVGDKFDINKDDELWLNNSISNMNPEPPNEHCNLLYQFSNLVVKKVDIIYLVGMKLASAREQDLKDVADILKHDDNKLPFELLSKLSLMNFDIDISVLLDTFGRAHGIAWLDKFYRSNEAELRKYY